MTFQNLMMRAGLLLIVLYSSSGHSDEPTFHAEVMRFREPPEVIQNGINSIEHEKITLFNYRLETRYRAVIKKWYTANNLLVDVACVPYFAPLLGNHYDKKIKLKETFEKDVIAYMADLIHRLLTKGMNCLSKLNDRAHIRAQLENMLGDKKRPLKIVCSEKDMRPRDAAARGALYKGGELEWPLISFKPTIPIELHYHLMAFIFHEILHNLGYGHGDKNPDYPEFCPHCCLENDNPLASDVSTEAACTICDGTFSSIYDRGYIDQLFLFTETEILSSQDTEDERRRLLTGLIVRDSTINDQWLALKIIQFFKSHEHVYLRKELVESLDTSITEGFSREEKEYRERIRNQRARETQNKDLQQDAQNLLRAIQLINSQQIDDAVTLLSIKSPNSYQGSKNEEAISTFHNLSKTTLIQHSNDIKKLQKEIGITSSPEERKSKREQLELYTRWSYIILLL